jgi:hypothetical protein
MVYNGKSPKRPSVFQQLGKSSKRSCLNPFSCRLVGTVTPSAGKNVCQISTAGKFGVFFKWGYPFFG